MKRLEKEHYQELYPLYQDNALFFPLIASVLLDKQEGEVYVNQFPCPTQAYVEHAFGFAQIFGSTDAEFEQKLQHYLLVNQDFNPPKIRLYAPYLPQFFTESHHLALLSIRQRFTLNTTEFFQKRVESVDNSYYDVPRLDRGIQQALALSNKSLYCSTSLDPAVKPREFGWDIERDLGRDVERDLGRDVGRGKTNGQPLIVNDTREKQWSLRAVDAHNISLVDDTFSIATRFWRNVDDFIDHANAVVAFDKNKPVSICYSAANANQCLEIDVLTLPEYRNQGLAKFTVSHFITRCLDLSLSPLWDCFTNNIGSMRLCQSVGFSPVNEPYRFLTINKP